MQIFIDERYEGHCLSIHGSITDKSIPIKTLKKNLAHYLYRYITDDNRTRKDHWGTPR